MAKTIDQDAASDTAAYIKTLHDVAEGTASESDLRAAATAVGKRPAQVAPHLALARRALAAQQTFDAGQWNSKIAAAEAEAVETRAQRELAVEALDQAREALGDALERHAIAKRSLGGLTSGRALAEKLLRHELDDTTISID